MAKKLTAAEVARTTVIFDARHPPPDLPTRTVIAGLKVEFANPGGDADVALAAFLDHHSAPKQLTLVSSDHQVQGAARRRGAKFIDSDAFFDQLERRERTRAAAVTEEKPTAAQTDYWLKIFGDISMK